MSMLEITFNVGQRAFGSSIASLINSLKGLAHGPILIGMLSDGLAFKHGAKLLNYGISIFCSLASFISAGCRFWTPLAMPSGIAYGYDERNDGI